MTTCTRCGHQVEVGRFCTNCGTPVEPSTARYPLFADEVAAESGEPAGPGPALPERDLPGPPGPGPARVRRRRPGWPVWVVTAAVLVAVGLAGARLLLADGSAERPERGTGATPPAAEPTDDPPESPDQAPEEPGEPRESREVAAEASAEVPATAPPGTDVDGTRVRYDAENLLDGDPGTCWRMTGDGSGTEIVLSLAEPTALTEVGLVNGYAKTARDARDRPLDWYAGNRRILAVEWELDDGTVVPQDLRETRDVQRVELDATVTEKVVLRLLEVSPPGRGRSARDNTAVSEISLVGFAP